MGRAATWPQGIEVGFGDLTAVLQLLLGPYILPHLFPAPEESGTAIWILGGFYSADWAGSHFTQKPLGILALNH